MRRYETTVYPDGFSEHTFQYYLAADVDPLLARHARLEQLIEPLVEFIGRTPESAEAKQICVLGIEYLQVYFNEEERLLADLSEGEGGP